MVPRSDVVELGYRLIRSSKRGENKFVTPSVDPKVV
jgi:hypothetical protein